MVVLPHSNFQKLVPMCNTMYYITKIVHEYYTTVANHTNKFPVEQLPNIQC